MISNKRVYKAGIVLLSILPAFSTRSCGCSYPGEDDAVCVGQSGPPGLQVMLGALKGTLTPTTPANQTENDVTDLDAINESSSAPQATNTPLTPGGSAPEVQTSPLQAPVHAIGETRDRRVVVVARRKLQILNLGTNAIESSLDLSGFGARAGVSDDNAFAAVGVRDFGSGASGIDIINLRTMTRIRTIGLPANTRTGEIAFLPGTHDFCAAMPEDNAVRCFSLDAGGSTPFREFADCEGANDLIFTADGERGLFACGDSIWVYDVLTDSVIVKIPGFTNILALTARTDGTRAYATNRNDGDDMGFLVVVSLETYEIINTAEVMSFPIDVFLGSNDERVYVLSGSSLHIADRDGVVGRITEPPGFALVGLAVNVGLR